MNRSISSWLARVPVGLFGIRDEDEARFRGDRGDHRVEIVAQIRDSGTSIVRAPKTAATNL